MACLAEPEIRYAFVRWLFDSRRILSILHEPCVESNEKTQQRVNGSRQIMMSGFHFRCDDGSRSLPALTASHQNESRVFQNEAYGCVKTVGTLDTVSTEPFDSFCVIHKS